MRPRGDGIGQQHERHVPFGSCVAEPLGNRDRAAKAQVDARRAREQSSVRRVIGSPGDAAPRELLTHHVIDGTVDGGPEHLQELLVTGGKEVLPCPHRDVGGDVRVERAVDDAVARVVRIPATMGQLLVDEPLQGSSRVCMPTPRVERHRRLDHVPRIGLASWHPRDPTAGLLHARDRIDRVRHGELRNCLRGHRFTA